MTNNVDIKITASAAQAQSEMARLSGSLERLTGAFKRLGHYGAAALALPSLAGVGRAAVQAGIDVVRLADAMTLLDARMTATGPARAKRAQRAMTLRAPAGSGNTPLRTTGTVTTVPGAGQPGAPPRAAD